MAEVRVGQEYKDLDRRYSGRAADRHVIVKGFTEEAGKPAYVICDVLIGGEPKRGSDKERQTKIRIDRLQKASRFKLIKDA